MGLVIYIFVVVYLVEWLYKTTFVIDIGRFRYAITNGPDTLCCFEAPNECFL